MRAKGNWVIIGLDTQLDASFPALLDNHRIDGIFEDTVREALKQVIDKKYAAVLQEKGVPMEKIRVYGIASKGKDVLVDGGYLSELRENLACRGFDAECINCGL